MSRAREGKGDKQKHKYNNQLNLLGGSCLKPKVTFLITDFFLICVI